MALERLSLGPALADADGEGGGDDDGRKPSLDGGDDGCRAPRLPRWTRQEILVLIQGKKMAEARVRRGRAAGMAFGSVQVEPKWESVSSYCKRHGVNRGPVQCRKRWSNLAGDYKKIKEWESQIREEAESFWVMRNDSRRERRLPGFFDREVYDILDGGTTTAASVAPGVLGLGLAPSTTAAEEGEEIAAAADEAEALFNSGRSAAAEDGLFSDFEQSAQEEAGGGSPVKEVTLAKEVPATTIPAPVPISEKQYQPFAEGCPSQGMTHGTRQTSNPEMGTTSQEGHKRRRFSAEGEDETNNLQYQLIEVLERNGRMLTAQLEAQNTHFQLEREQRKENMGSLVAVLNKLADALGRIADKL